ncbi:MAG TPA: NADH-quinone oxidoreductase subunit J, partial [Thermomicrobiales bacterium]|nr:NADH-quinone oxidoreductase subunit J [Thermomicrobiales bacterium]
ADFVGAMQLMIYVGGTLVLLVFGVMLTAQGPFVSMKTRGGDWILAALLSGSLLAFLVPAAFSVREWTNAAPAAAEGRHAAAGREGAKVKVRFASTAAPRDEPAPENADESSATVPPGMATQPATATRLGMGLLGVRVDKLEGRPKEFERGMSAYLLPFEIVSVHLLVVLVGAAYLARAKRRATR